jgi:TonB family protein
MAETKINVKKIKGRGLAVAVMAIVCGSLGLNAQDVKKVSRDEAMSAAISKVHPDYPPAAKQLKIEGTVEIDIVIDESGNVEKASSVSGNAMLTRPAADALKRWKFKPFQENGKPVKAEATLAVTFKL